jgi:hypothetical protein
MDQTIYDHSGTPYTVSRKRSDARTVVYAVRSGGEIVARALVDASSRILSEVTVRPAWRRRGLVAALYLLIASERIKTHRPGRRRE